MSSRDTASDEAREQIDESQRFLATLLEVLPGIAYRCDGAPGYAVAFASSGCLELTGYRPDEFTSGSLSLRDLVQPEDRERASEAIETATRERTPFDMKYRIRTRDGQIRQLRDRGTAVFAEDGSLRFLEGFINDITEQEQVTADLRDALQRALDAEKLASITTLTAGIAHDVGTPMTAILGYAELIAKSADSEKNRKRANTIVEQVHRVSKLIETLVNLQYTDEYEIEPLDIARVLDEALDFYREKLRRHRIRIERDFSGSPRISGDRDRLQQAFLNLVLNAVEAMPDGGELRISAVEAPGNKVEIRVADTGHGVDPAIRRLIFDPYFTTKERTRGTGLGLLVARSIVEDHGGTLDLAEGVATGSEFCITLPGRRGESGKS